MESGRRITLADLDRLDGGSFEKMLRDISKITGDKKEIDALVTLHILRNFSQRLKKDRQEESSSNVSARQEVGTNQGLEDNGFKQCMERTDHAIHGKHEGDEKEEFHAANSAEEKKGRKIIKIRRRKHNNGKNIESAELALDPPPNLQVSIREIVARKEKEKRE